MIPLELLWLKAVGLLTSAKLNSPRIIRIMWAHKLKLETYIKVKVRVTFMSEVSKSCFNNLPIDKDAREFKRTSRQPSLLPALVLAFTYQARLNAIWTAKLPEEWNE